MMRTIALALVLAFLSVVVTGCGATPTPIQDSSGSTQQTATGTTTSSDDLVEAREILATFFEVLNSGRYAEAVQIYGGDYETLRDWNPGTAPDDYPKLLENGCEGNGLQCLKVRNVVREEQVSPTEFRFVVEFSNEDGTLFKQGPCCGASETEQPTKTQFDYIVMKSGDKFLVRGLPVYVP